MKKIILLTVTILACMTAASLVSAQVDMYPLGGGDSSSIPITIYQPGYPYPGYQGPTLPSQLEPIQWYHPGPVQQPNNCPQPYYDYSTGRWVQPECYNDPQPYNPQPYNPGPYNPQPYNPGPYNPGPYNPQPYNPGSQNGNVKVSRQQRNNGTIDLTWEIMNTTTENWSKENYDIKCISGCYLLTNSRQTLWDIPYTVNRNSTLTFTVNISQQGWYDSMTFAIVAGSKTIYTFTVNP